MDRRTLIIIGGVVVALCCICLAVIGVIAAVGGLASIGLTQPAVSTGDSFMTALRDSNYTQAYSLCTTDLQEELGDVDGLQALIEENDVKPTKWSFTSRNVSGDRAELEGDATFTGDREGTVEMVLVLESGSWKVAGFRLREK